MKDIKVLAQTRDIAYPFFVTLSLYENMRIS